MTGISEGVAALLDLERILPRISRWAGKKVVIKYGGAAIASQERGSAEGPAGGGVAEASPVLPVLLVLLQMAGARPCLVHGGGPEVSAWMRRLGKEPVFIGGRRVTDEETLSIAEMVLAGKVNKALVGAIQRAGGRACGISGKDGGVLRARRASFSSSTGEPVDLGFVGEVISVETGLLELLGQGGFIPVIASLGLGECGETLNINADTAAAAIAAALEAEAFVLLTDVPGILRDPADPATLFPRLTPAEARGLLADGTVRGGMIPKVEACLSVLAKGVGEVVIMDGRDRYALPSYILGEAFAGTVIGVEQG